MRELDYKPKFVIAIGSSADVTRWLSFQNTLVLSNKFEYQHIVK